MSIKLFTTSLLLFSFYFVGISQDTLMKIQPILTKKERRIEKRYVHPKSVFIRYSFGVIFNKMRFSEENEHFNRSLFKESFLNFSLETEVGTKNDFFYEFGVKYREYRYAYSVKEDWFYEQHPRYFDGFLIYGGYGKRLRIKKSNLNIVNLQVGLSFYINRMNYELNNIANDLPISRGNDSLIKAYEITGERRVVPTLYFELSKDIRIYKRFYLTLNYRYDQGFASLYNQKFEIYKKSNSSEITTIHNSFRGTAHGFSIGFKHRFLSKKYRDN